ncbi:dihydropteroate synthase [Demequina muriae]|uniref:Dihydropteroate synthase n=1 Tax=Demequina muriae TaxID=3051664 RepID=A0ABT8GFE8_9MICO|nr:dihydropteroate synthase [Demequina sp. EGI L300058]MDN4480158.1 dihydropteroate synthase [Demequina sp. EGI L300058]
MTLVMGILNVTPDSFSDGGRWHTADAAIARGMALAAEGADIVDVGGESTRPGATRVDPGEEVTRVLPVVEALAGEGITVSIDTMRARTARAAVDAGARYVNDVSGGLADPEMTRIVAELECEYIAGHWRAFDDQIDAPDAFGDVVAEVRHELLQRVRAFQDAGVDSNRIVIDPGLGFGKGTDENWGLLAHLDVLRAMGPRILVGASRKRFVGAAIARDGVPDADPAARDHATTAITTLCAQQDVWGVRVHDARAARDAIQVVSAWQNALERQR